MKRQGCFWGVTLGVAAIFLAGCSGDPNVRKQKYLESGKRYAADGKYREAAIQYQNALKVDKSYADAHFELAHAYEHLDQLRAAYPELARTVDLAPGNLKARIELGNLLLAGGRTDDAQTQANAIMAAQPNNPDVHAMLSAIALRKGQKDQALVEIHRALDLDPNRAVFHEDLALLQSGDTARTSSVEDELKNAISLDPKSVNAKLLLAAFYVKAGRLPEAEKVSWDAVSTDPKSLQARTNVAGIVLREGDKPRAEQVLSQASKDLASDPEGVRILGDYYASSGQLDKAKTEFAALAAKYPKSVTLPKAYTRVLLETKDYATAQTVVAGLLKSNPKDPEVAGLNGIVLLNQGKTNDAVVALQTAVKEFPKDAFLQSWLGRAALAKGDVDLAETSLRQAVTLAPTRLDAQQELAQIAIQRGDLNQLSDVAGKTITAAPRFPGGYVWRAIVEISRNASDPQGEADLKTAMSVAPQSPQAYLELGKLRFAQKRFPEGVTLLEQTLQYDPNSTEALHLLVSYDLFQKQPDKGMARLNAQIDKSPKNSGLYDMLAELQAHNNNLDQAAATAQKAIELNSADGSAVMLLAQIDTQRGKTADAIATWEQWSKAHPNDAGPIAMLGTLEEARGDRAKAEAYYKKALELQPKQALAANNLAYLMLENGENVDVALTLAQTARQGMPNAPTTADTLAWAYYYKGTYQFARDLLEDALKNQPDNAAMQYHLGMVYSKLKDKDNATLHLKKAISLGPNLPEAKDAKTALEGLS